MENSHIQWTDHTFNPWIGCTKISPGCTHCYAEAQNQRWRHGANWGKDAPRSRTSAANWKGPVKWNAQARFMRANPPEGFTLSPHRRPRVFCASLADWLDDEAPIEWLADLLALIIKTPNLDWLLLTKRPENWEGRMRAVLSAIGKVQITLEEATLRVFVENWLIGWNGVTHCVAGMGENLWLGCTVENQDYAARHAHLMAIPAQVHFWSVEPMLSGISASMAWGLHGKPDWVICGGESGRGARAMNEAWAQSLASMCKLNDVAFFMKQMGGSRDARGDLAQIPEALRIRQFPNEKLTAKD